TAGTTARLGGGLQPGRQEPRRGAGQLAGAGEGGAREGVVGGERRGGEIPGGPRRPGLGGGLQPERDVGLGGGGSEPRPAAAAGAGRLLLHGPDGQQLELRVKEGGAQSVSFSPAGRRVAAAAASTSSSPGFVRVWDVDSGAVLQTLETATGDQCCGVTFSPSG